MDVCTHSRVISIMLKSGRVEGWKSGRAEPEAFFDYASLRSERFRRLVFQGSCGSWIAVIANRITSDEKVFNLMGIE
jgi:hypothetical protein